MARVLIVLHHHNIIWTTRWYKFFFDSLQNLLRPAVETCTYYCTETASREKPASLLQKYKTQMCQMPDVVFFDPLYC